MRGLSLFNKIVFVINMFVALLLLFACLVPYLPIHNFPYLSFLSLAVPVLVGCNALFMLYWVFKRKRHLVVSLFVLVFGYFMLGTFVKLNFSEKEPLDSDLKVLSYNVRGFNKDRNIKSETVFADIRAFVNQENPDIVCFQEVGYSRRKEYVNYPYQYLEYINNYDKALLGIFSKYPIIDAGLLNFPKSRNNGSYADIQYKNDTVRVYNLHLESLKVRPHSFTEEKSDKLLGRLNRSFEKQEEQIKIIKQHTASWPHKKIVLGDFNNTQFSRPYTIIKEDMLDTFVEKGSGYGRTINFWRFPLRIDFILADPELEVISHKNYDVRFSDHYPVMASFRLSDN